MSSLRDLTQSCGIVLITLAQRTQQTAKNILHYNVHQQPRKEKLTFSSSDSEL